MLEILVSVGLLAILGTGLSAVLSQGIGLWRRAERRALVYDKARVLLDAIAEDLCSTVVHNGSRADGGWIRFLGDHDAEGRQRLRFVRTISGETEDPLLREGGVFTFTHPPARHDGIADRFEARAGLLGAPGGLTEVFWALDPGVGRDTLYRAERTPIGGPGTLFDDATVTATASANDGTPERAFGPLARPLADGVLFCRFAYWGPTTNTWDPFALPLARAREGQPSGALFHWDSTRALLEYQGGPEELFFSARDGSLLDPGDDVFPQRVEVTLVLREDGQDSAFVTDKIVPTAQSFLISRPISLPEGERDRFVRVGDEWIELESVDGVFATVRKDGRGSRGTIARTHERGTPIEVGVTFRRVVQIPGARSLEAWKR